MRGGQIQTVLWVVFVMLFSEVDCILMHDLCDSKAKSKPIKTQCPTACAAPTPHEDVAHLIGLGEVVACGRVNSSCKGSTRTCDKKRSNS